MLCQWLDSYPCPQGHQPSALPNWATPPPPAVEVDYNNVPNIFIFKSQKQKTIRLWNIKCKAKLQHANVKCECMRIVEFEISLALLGSYPDLWVCTPYSYRTMIWCHRSYESVLIPVAVWALTCLHSAATACCALCCSRTIVVFGFQEHPIFILDAGDYKNLLNMFIFKSQELKTIALCKFKYKVKIQRANITFFFYENCWVWNITSLITVLACYPDLWVCSRYCTMIWCHHSYESVGADPHVPPGIDLPEQRSNCLLLRVVLR